MKIENQRNVIQFEANRASEKKPIESQTSTASSNASKSQDQVDSRLTDALNGAVEAIQKSGLSPAEVHSQVDESVAQGLLRSSAIDSRSPRLNDDELLKMAEQVQSDSQTYPNQAYNAFNDLNPDRVSQLL